MVVVVVEVKEEVVVILFSDRSSLAEPSRTSRDVKCREDECNMCGRICALELVAFTAVPARGILVIHAVPFWRSTLYHFGH